MTTRIAGFKKESVIDGPGIRAVVFFQGCHHHCPGCHNPDTWDVSAGTEMPIEDIWQNLAITPLIRGITLSGGEPFLQPAAAIYLARQARADHLDVWIYSGYTFEQLLELQQTEIQNLLEYCDVLVDGPFRQEQKRLDLPYRGSANQRLIAIPATLREKQIVLWDPATG